MSSQDFIKKPQDSPTTEEIFTEIYQNHKWDGLRGDFCSGDGSINPQIVEPYLAVIAEMAASEGFRGLTFVDLGCGDFRIGQQLLLLCSNYIGVDIVKPLIQQNRKEYGNATTQFFHLDIVESELPDGDVCFLRQVLQHLSNQQILTVLPKLSRYKWVFITENYPLDEQVVQPNLDQPCWVGTRVDRIPPSAVYLSLPPFNLPKPSLRKILEVSGNGRGKEYKPGVIRTFLYQPSLN